MPQKLLPLHIPHYGSKLSDKYHWIGGTPTVGPPTEGFSIFPQPAGPHGDLS